MVGLQSITKAKKLIGLENRGKEAFMSNFENWTKGSRVTAISVGSMKNVLF